MSATAPIEIDKVKRWFDITKHLVEVVDAEFGPNIEEEEENVMLKEMEEWLKE